MAIRFHFDEHVDPAIAAGLRRRGIEVTTTEQARLRGGSDLDHVAFARSQKRVIYTNDPDFLRLAASGIPHRGIAFNCAGARGVGQVIEHLLLMHACMSEEDMLNHVEFL